MPRTCTICRHSERAAVDAALVAGTPFRDIAARFGVSTGALGRHRADHLAPAVVQAAKEAEATQALDVVKQLKVINAASLAILRDARESRDHRLALQAVDRVQRQIELQARLLGQLDDRPTVNVLVAPEWLTVRAALLAALTPYPEVRSAVASRLLELEAGG